MSRSSPSPKKDKIKLLIFDFDGVLADSFDSFYPLIRDSMETIGISLEPDQYRNLFLGNVHQGFKDLINNRKKYSVFSKFRQQNYDKYYKARLFPGSAKAIKELSKDYILAIASSGKRSNIEALLKRSGIDELFHLILATTEYTKEGMLKKILRESGCRPQEALMITDTAGDIQIAKKLKLGTVGVSWGFHSEKVLKSARPNYIASSFKIMYKTLKAF